MKIVLLLLGLISTANALCQGESSPCSGHGNCVADDKCVCFRDYTGVGCAEKRCPYTKSWGSAVSGSADAHAYEECGGRGICDVATGTCVCFDGYTGRGCARMACQNNCNGRGKCETLSRVSGGSYTGWDADMIQMCVCDPGFTGVSCEKRICPKGNDPLTSHDAAGNVEADNVVKFTVDDTTGSATDQIVFVYTSHKNEVFKSHPVKTQTISEIAVEEALLSLPNHVIPAISCTIADTGNDKEITCTFSNALLGGDQFSRLSIDKAACTADGCQPVTQGASTTATVSDITSGTTEHIECSGRGTCNFESGVCACAPGYHGEACQIQTTMT